MFVNSKFGNICNKGKIQSYDFLKAGFNDLNEILSKYNLHKNPNKTNLFVIATKIPDREFREKKSVMRCYKRRNISKSKRQISYKYKSNVKIN